MMTKIVRYNWKRNLALGLVLMLITTFFVTIGMTVSNVQHLLYAKMVQSEGEWDLYIQEADEQVEDKCREETSIQKVGLAYTEEQENIDKERIKEKKIRFQYYDKDAIKICALPILEGRLPEKENEIAISAGMKIEDGYAYQQEVIGKTWCGPDGQKVRIVGILDNMNAGLEDENRICVGYKQKIAVNTHKCSMYVCFAGSEMKLVGSNHSVRKASYDLCKKLGVSREDIYDWQRIKTEDGQRNKEDYPVWLNNNRLFLLEHGNSQKTMQVTGVIACILTVLVLFVGGFMLASTILKDYATRKKDLALLHLCGCTKGQLKRWYLIEKYLLCFVACPAGVVVGYQLAGRLLWEIQERQYRGIHLVYNHFSILMCMISIGMMGLVLLFSVLFGFRQWKSMFAKDALYKDREKCYTGKNVTLHSDLFKTDRVSMTLSGMYLRRKKGNSVFCISCVAVTVFLFLVFCNFSTVVSQLLEQYQEKEQFEFFLYSNVCDKIQTIKKEIPFVDECELLYDDTAKIEGASGEELLSKDCKKYYSDIYAKETEPFYVDVVGIDENFYNNYLIGEDKVAYKKLVKMGGCVYDDSCRLPKSEKEIFTMQNRKKQEVRFTVTTEEGKTKTEDAVLATRVRRYHTALDNCFQPTVYVPQELFLKMFTPSFTLLHINAIAGYENDLQAWLLEHAAKAGVSVQDNISEYMETKDMVLMVQWIFGGIVLVVSIIAIGYVIAILKNNMEEQKSEWRILHRIGMSGFRIWKVAFWECSSFAIGGWLLGMLGATLFSNYIVEQLARVNIVQFAVPVTSYLLILAGVWFGAGLLSVHSYATKKL